MRYQLMEDLYGSEVRPFALTNEENTVLREVRMSQLQEDLYHSMVSPVEHLDASD